MGGRGGHGGDVTPNEAAFEIWAPPGGRWSPWVKPILFAGLDASALQATEVSGSDARAQVPGTDAETALVIDLPGPEALETGLALAKRGHRPVPLFNGVPGPPGSEPLVNLQRVVRLLGTLTDDLGRLDLSPDAPPAFLLDHDRMAGGRTPRPGQFDNRWMAFPQDFPSASFLLAHRIRRIVVVESSGRSPAEDLVHVLLRYREAGIEVLIESVDAPGQLRPAQLVRPWWFRAMFYRALVLLRLRRSSGGGFGAKVPHPTRSGGFYG